MEKKCFIEKIRENYMNVFLLTTVPVLGCSSTLLNALTIALVLSFVLFFSNIIVFLLRSKVSETNRKFFYVLISAFVTTLSGLFLQLIDLDVYASVSKYLPLVVFSSLLFMSFEETQTQSFRSCIDNLSYKIISLIFVLIFIGAFREFFGLGEILGYKIVDYGIPKVLVLQTSAGAFFMLAFVSFVFNWVRGEK